MVKKTLVRKCNLKKMHSINFLVGISCVSTGASVTRIHARHCIKGIVIWTTHTGKEQSYINDLDRLHVCYR